MPPQLRLENGRAVITEIDDLANWIVTEKIPPPRWLPGPCILDVMSDGSHRYLRILMPIDGTALFFRMGTITTSGKTTFAHDSLRVSWFQVDYPPLVQVPRGSFLPSVRIQDTRRSAPQGEPTQLCVRGRGQITHIGLCDQNRGDGGYGICYGLALQPARKDFVVEVLSASDRRSRSRRRWPVVFVT